MEPCRGRAEAHRTISNRSRWAVRPPTHRVYPRCAGPKSCCSSHRRTYFSASSTTISFRCRTSWSSTEQPNRKSIIVLPRSVASSRACSSISAMTIRGWLLRKKPWRTASEVQPYNLLSLFKNSAQIVNVFIDSASRFLRARRLFRRRARNDHSSLTSDRCGPGFRQVSVGASLIRARHARKSGSGGRPGFRAGHCAVAPGGDASVSPE
jgi:hypothetical protein